MLNRIGLSLNFLGAIFIALEIIGLERFKRLEKKLEFFLESFNLKNWYYFTQGEKGNIPKYFNLFGFIHLVLGILVIYLFFTFIIPNRNDIYLFEILSNLNVLIIRYYLWIFGIIFFIIGLILMNKLDKKYEPTRLPKKAEKKFLLAIFFMLLAFTLFPFGLMFFMAMLAYYFIVLLLSFGFFIIIRICLFVFAFSLWVKRISHIQSIIIFSGILFLTFGYLLQLIATF